jgi:transcriptional regulator with XRE-family HTH domain
MEKRDFLILVGKRIKEEREQKGWSQADLAYRIGKDQPSINRVEKGHSNPTIFYLKEIANGLDVSLQELIKGV